jgi:hypothetical protein
MNIKELVEVRASWVFLGQPFMKYRGPHIFMELGQQQNLHHFPLTAINHTHTSCIYLGFFFSFLQSCMYVFWLSQKHKVNWTAFYLLVIFCPDYPVYRFQVYCSTFEESPSKACFFFLVLTPSGNVINVECWNKDKRVN